MFKQTKGFIVGLLVGVLLISSMGAVLATEKAITALFDNIKIYVDGNLIVPKDARGSVVEPFIYNGTTYLPVRAIGEALGKSVSWDGDTNTVYLGVKPGADLRLGEDINAYNTTSGYLEYPAKGSFMMAGIKYNSGVRSYCDQNALYNFDKKYTRLSGIYGPVDGVNAAATGTINFYGDDKLLTSLSVKYGELPKEFTVEVKNVSQLKVEFKGTDYFALANVVVQ